MNGKCQEDFTNWVREQEFDFKYKDLSDSLKDYLFLKWADTVGYHISSHYLPNTKEYHCFISFKGMSVSLSKFFAGEVLKDVPSARAESIKEAINTINVIYNKK